MFHIICIHFSTNIIIHTIYYFSFLQYRFRLIDTTKELSFHLSLPHKQQTSSIYNVTNMDDVTAFIAPASASSKPIPPNN